MARRSSRKGDSITFTGKLLGYSDLNQMLSFELSKLVN